MGSEGAGFDLSRMSVQEAADAIARQVGAFKRARDHSRGAAETDAAGMAMREPRPRPDVLRADAPEHPLPRMSPPRPERAEPRLDEPKSATPVRGRLVALEEDRVASSSEFLAAAVALPSSHPDRPSGRRWLWALAVFAVVMALGATDLPQRLAALWHAPAAPAPDAVSGRPAPQQATAPAPPTSQAGSQAGTQIGPRQTDPATAIDGAPAASPPVDSPAAAPAIIDAGDVAARPERPHEVTPPGRAASTEPETAALAPVLKPGPPAEQAAEQTTLAPVARSGNALAQVPIHAPQPLDLATKPRAPRPAEAKPFIPAARPFVPAQTAQPGAQSLAPAASAFVPKPFVPQGTSNQAPQGTSN